MDLVEISFLVVERSRASEVCDLFTFDLSWIAHSFRTPLNITLFLVKDVDFSDALMQSFTEWPLKPQTTSKSSILPH